MKKAECFCGADIHTLATFDDDLWVDDRGNDRCYPTAPGRDGEARHEPLEETIREVADRTSANGGNDG